MQEKKFIEAKFPRNLAEEPAALTAVISIDNLNQTGEKFKSLANHINAHSEETSHLTIVDTTYLNRHYNEEYGQIVETTDWQKKNQKYLNKLKVSYSLVRWHEFLNCPTVEAARLKLLESYESPKTEDEYSFRKQTDRYVEEFRLKKGVNPESAFKYLLEECSVMVKIPGRVCYPGKLNEALKIAIKILNLKVVLVKYKLESKCTPKDIIESPKGEKFHFFQNERFLLLDKKRHLKPEEKNLYFMFFALFLNAELSSLPIDNLVEDLHKIFYKYFRELDGVSLNDMLDLVRTNNISSTKKDEAIPNVCGRHSTDSENSQRPFN